MKAETSPRAEGPTGLPVIDSVEVAFGAPFGPSVPLGIGPSRAVHPTIQLERILRDAVVATPCVVAFSGGRDSSLILSLVAGVAQEMGAPPPVALTVRCPSDPLGDEAEWQELVVRHLRAHGLPFSWEIHDVSGEMDLLGPEVTAVVADHGGPVWPAALGMFLVLLDRARGGALVTGEFGDEVLGARRATYVAGAVRRRGRGMTTSDWHMVTEAIAPGPLRRRYVAGRTTPRPWLRPGSASRYVMQQIDEALEEPLRWDRSVMTERSHASVRIGLRSRQVLSSRYECRLVDPLGEPSFLAAFAGLGGWTGPPSRAAATRLLSRTPLPDPLLRRADKAAFNNTVFGPRFHRFVQNWDGVGVDAEIVDVADLKREWAKTPVHGGTALLAQQAWYAAQVGTQLR